MNLPELTPVQHSNCYPEALNLSRSLRWVAECQGLHHPKLTPMRSVGSSVQASVLCLETRELS